MRRREVGGQLLGVGGGDVPVVGSRHEQQPVAELAQDGEVARLVVAQGLPQGGEITGRGVADAVAARRWPVGRPVGAWGEAVGVRGGQPSAQEIHRARCVGAGQGSEAAPGGQQPGARAAAGQHRRTPCGGRQQHHAPYAGQVLGVQGGEFLQDQGAQGVAGEHERSGGDEAGQDLVQVVGELFDRQRCPAREVWPCARWS